MRRDAWGGRLFASVLRLLLNWNACPLNYTGTLFYPFSWNFVGAGAWLLGPCIFLKYRGIAKTRMLAQEALAALIWKPFLLGSKGCSRLDHCDSEVVEAVLFHNFGLILNVLDLCEVTIHWEEVIRARAYNER